MGKSYAAHKKSKEIKREELQIKLKSIEDLIKNNDQIFDRNKRAMENVPVLLKANQDLFDAEKERFDITSKMVKLELDHMKMINPIQEFHTMPEWQNLFRKSKEFESKEIAKEFGAAALEFESRKKSIESFEFAFGKPVKLEELEAQQQRWLNEKPVQEENLKSIKAELDGIKTTPNYIG